MQYLKKFASAIKDGTLREIWQETGWILQHTRDYRREIVIFILLGLVGTALNIGSALATKELINAIAYIGKLDGYGGVRIALTGISVVILAASGILFNALSSRYNAKVSLRVNNKLRAEVYETILNTDWESLQEFHSGDLLNRVNSDVNTVASSVLGWVPSLIIRVAQFVFSLGVILWFDPTMALLALITAPITLIIAKPLMGRMRNLSKKMREVSSDMMAFHEESLQNAQSIKAFNLVQPFSERLDRVQNSYLRTALQFNRFSIFNSSLLSLCGTVIGYLCLGWGAYRLWMHRIDFGTMVLFLQLASYLSSAVTALIQLIPSAIEASVAARRVMNVFDLPREKTDGHEQAEAMAAGGKAVRLEVKDLTFTYRARASVLENVQMTVEPGETVAIIGPSGSGKTTLFRILLGLLNAENGTAKVSDGEQTLTLSPATRCLFSYVPQDNVIFSGTVADTLRLVRPQATDEELYAALRVACAEDFVRALPAGLNTRMKERGSTLSVGQNQRLAIARAILADAPILLLDEVTSALDLETEERVLENISKLRNKTCIFTTHRRSVLTLCSNVYRIHGTQMEKLTPQQRSELGRA